MCDSIVRDNLTSLLDLPRFFIEYLSRDPLGDYRKNATFRVNPIIDSDKGNQAQRRTQNRCLNLLYGCWYFELMCTFSITLWLVNHSITLFVLSMVLKAVFYMIMLYGWIYAQKEARPHYFSPIALKIAYYILYCSLAVTFILLARQEGGSSRSYQWLQDTCLFIVHFPNNLFSAEENVINKNSKVLMFVIPLVFQLWQMIMLIRCWRYISNLRRTAQLPSYETVSTNRPLQITVASIDQTTQYETVTENHLSPAYKDVTADDPLPTYETVTADDVLPDYDTAVTTLSK